MTCTILMGARRLHREGGVRILVDLSQTSNRKLRDVADAIVESTQGSAEQEEQTG